VTGREVVETDDVLPQPEQRFQQVGSDEAGNARDKPPPGRRAQG
jgi:hypothetical protein